MKGNEKLHGQTSCSLKHRQLAERRSCCVVEQTSKADASNSFSVTLCDPAAPLFLHMHTDHTNHVWCALAHPLTHTSTHTVQPLHSTFMLLHHLNSLLLSWLLRSGILLPSKSTYPAASHSITVRNLSQLSWPLISESLKPGHPPTPAPLTPYSSPQVGHLWKRSTVCLLLKLAL